MNNADKNASTSKMAGLTEHSFFLEYLERKKDAQNRARENQVLYCRHCCTCTEAEGAHWVKQRQSRIRPDHIFQRNSKIELSKKPRPYILPIENSYQFTCQRCKRKNMFECRAVDNGEKNIDDIYRAVEKGVEGKIIILAKYLGVEGLNYQRPESLLAPLHLCSANHSLYCAIELIDSGCNIDILEREKKTPLWIACSLPDRHELVELLLKSGADPDHMNAKGSTCLMAAVISEECEYVSMLIEYGVNVNAFNPTTGETALWKAAKLGSIFMIRELMLAGARKDIINFAGVSPLEVAKKRKCLGFKFEKSMELLNTEALDELVKLDLEENLELKDEEEYAEDLLDKEWEKAQMLLNEGDGTDVEVSERKATDCAADGATGEDWEYWWDDEHQAYYWYNKVSGETQWASEAETPEA